MSALNKTRRNNKRDLLSILSNGSNSNISIKEVIILQNKWNKNHDHETDYKEVYL
jgi:hypothetical protein